MFLIIELIIIAILIYAYKTYVEEYPAQMLVVVFIVAFLCGAVNEHIHLTKPTATYSSCP